MRAYLLENYTKEQIVESVFLSKAQSNFLKKSYKQSKRKKRLFWNRYESNWYNPIDNHGWRLPATKDPRENCGKFVTKGCLNKSNHPGRKNWIKHCELSCFRKDCSVCFEKWLDRASNRATRRIEKYEKISGKPAKHIVISPPKWDWNLSYPELKEKARQIMKESNILGGNMIFHPFRYYKEKKEWYWSPHFHIVGFGWIEHVGKISKKTGWVIKNIGKRHSIYSTIWYELSHCGNKDKIQSIVWFGDLSYSNAKYSKLLKEEEEESLDLCPICEHMLLDIVCTSEKKPPPIEFEGWDDEYQWRYLKDIDVQLWKEENPDRDDYPKYAGLRKYVMFRNYSEYVTNFSI